MALVPKEDRSTKMERGELLRALPIILKISDNDIWAQTVGDCNKGWIYGIGTIYSKSYSPASMSGTRPASTDVEDIRDRVYALNKSGQR